MLSPLHNLPYSDFMTNGKRTRETGVAVLVGVRVIVGVGLLVDVAVGVGAALQAVSHTSKKIDMITMWFRRIISIT